MLLTIRSAETSDEEQVTELWRACGLVTSYNDPSSDFLFSKKGQCSDVLVGVDKAGCIRGSVMVGHDGHRGWLYYVAAHPGTCNSGHGRQMVDAAEAWLRERGVQKVQLMVRETNTKVIAF